MATKTLVPQSETKFDQWVRNFVRTLTHYRDNYRISECEVDELNNLLTEWDRDFANATAARDHARAAVEQKDEARTALETAVRDVTRVIQADKHVTDAARRDAGIPVHKTTRTPVPVPKSFPLGQVIVSDRLEHLVSFCDAATPTRRARPNGCTGAEIYLAVADAAPTNPEDYRFVALATRSPHAVTFKSEDGGETANYLLRWVNTRGEVGPWGQVVSATIPAV